MGSELLGKRIEKPAWDQSLLKNKPDFQQLARAISEIFK
jgi:hypothetical protein